MFYRCLLAYFSSFSISLFHNTRPLRAPLADVFGMLPTRWRSSPETRSTFGFWIILTKHHCVCFMICWCQQFLPSLYISTVYLSVCLSLSLCMYVSLYVSLSVCPMVCRSVCMPICLFVCLCVRLTVCLSDFVCVFVRLPVCLPVCLSVCMFSAYWLLVCVCV